ncbi:hypothetical protein M501DRAFT_950152, partial [Patellaria atrata CBS 101060]
MGLFSATVKLIAPIFIVTSPITSYLDQIHSIHRTRSSAGFSLDIPLIMLLASILKVFYWLGSRYALSLLLQALLMIGMQSLLLHVALRNRPLSVSTHTPFAGEKAESSGRLYDFWRWRPVRPYWVFLAYFTLALVVLQVLGNGSESYTQLQGSVALTIEAALPLPQLLSNQRRRGCKGFRPSVVVNWLVGDVFKLSYFFLSGGGEVPLAFKACAVFQFLCDLGLGVQYL